MRRRESFILGRSAALAAASVIAGCKPYRVVYQERPAFYEKASASPLPDDVTLEDGTVVKYRPTNSNSSLGRMGPDRLEPFEIREEHEDGSVTLRAAVPEHVIVNTLACLRDEEYELLYNQMLPVRHPTRAAGNVVLSAGPAPEDEWGAPAGLSPPEQAGRIAMACAALTVTQALAIGRPMGSVLVSRIVGQSRGLPWTGWHEPDVASAAAQ